MSRVTVVTGAASGVGLATRKMLEARGERVIGVDLKGSDINTDLSTVDGRVTMINSVKEMTGGQIDGIAAIAGISAPIPTTVAVNYFGAVATLEGLRPFLEGSDSPRAVAVTSIASLQPNSPELVDACLGGDEAVALEIGTQLADKGPEAGYANYSSSKAALSRWIRRSAIRPEWAGAGIALNAVAPGVVLTPMTHELLATEEGRAQVFGAVPSPLNGGIGPGYIADLLVYLLSKSAAHLCGQVIFNDSGADATLRADSTW